MNLDQFTHTFPVQARWNDLDPLGHVNNAVYITYFEIGRSQFMLDASKTWNWHKHMFLIGKIGVTYLKELTLEHKNVNVHCRVARFGTKSFDIEYAITSTHPNGNQELNCIGSSTQVMFDMKTRTTTEVPAWLKEEILAYEKPGSVLA